MNTVTEPPYRVVGEFAAILSDLDRSILISTYQAGQVVLIRADGDGVALQRSSFSRPMGLAVDGSRIAVATVDSIVMLHTSAGDSPHGEGANEMADVAACYTGEMDIHDMAWGADSLWLVNTRYCCLCTAAADGSLTRRWQPPFVSAARPEDRCHLNGMALAAGEPEYVTALGATDTPKGWRERKADGGVLIHVPTGETVAGGLSMPHSPRLVDGRLYTLNAGSGELLQIDPATGHREVIIRLPGFTRGLAVVGSYLFVGLSKMRPNRTLGALALETVGPDLMCGVAVVHGPSGLLRGMFEFTTTIEELYDVHAVPATTRISHYGP